jgi:hypothetical protein
MRFDTKDSAAVLQALEPIVGNVLFAYSGVS